MRPLPCLLLAAASVLMATSCSSPQVNDADGRGGLDFLGRPPVADRQWTDKFDGHFRKYSKRFFSVSFDWRWFKAQGIAESGLRDDVTSWVGARGVMQIMPVTFQEIAEQTLIADIDDPKWNIAAGIFYDRYLHQLWADVDASAADRLAFTFASYNAGRRRTLLAQRSCGDRDCDRWREVAGFTPSETRGYVARIFQLMAVELAD